MNHRIQAVVAHKGAREHFLAARALHRRDALAALVTDWYSPLDASWRERLQRINPSLARALAATCDELPRDRVRALNGFGLRSRVTLRFAERRGRLLEKMMQDDQRFARRVATLDLPPHNVFLGFSYAALEALEAERKRGVLTVVDQIDPGRTEWELVREEAERWPAYADPMGPPAAGYYERAEAEWRAADIVLVNSVWSRDALVRQGADAARIRVIPLAYEAPERVDPRPVRTSAPFTVLWLGSVILRKGIPYLVEAARTLADEPVRFVVAGPIGIHTQAMRDAPPNVEWRGPVPRGAAQALYREADLFVLPTISDGFAITQVEALANGVPVIATPNCGDVVEEGKTGFLVPARDAAALAEAIRRFVREPGLAARMRESCLATASRFSIEAYADRLTSILYDAVAARGGER
ncbi:MAG TPA: glycosyltransferase family 4 protein [Kiritimatiellia bacterium]|nr:glycosyltransferase family 4 protein [Kiritimatiellia bacterium]